jgi:BirA family biotin operon repressor/biotin-[acetyl-CoA-carboxylase] ligase
MSGAAPLPPELADALARVAPRLGRLGRDVRFFPSIQSTNDVAASLAASGQSEGAVVIADAQTAGRGRRGRSWFSPPGAGLYVSVVLAPARSAVTPARAVSLLTLAAGVALSEAIERATGLPAEIKWPNDLLTSGRKLAGILAEGIVAPQQGSDVPAVSAVVLGYGINVGAAAYPPELAARATSLESELGRSVDRALVCAESLAALAVRYDDLLAGRFDAILDAWHARAPRSRGAHVRWETPGGVRSGVTAGVDDFGALLVRVPGGIERLVAGEIVWADRTP